MDVVIRVSTEVVISSLKLFRKSSALSKVHIFSWKLLLDRVPSCQNLFMCKVIADSESLGYMVSWEVHEWVNHMFDTCVSRHGCATRFVGG